MWHSTHSDLLLVRVFELEFRARASLYERADERRVWLLRYLEKRTQRRRHSSDIVVNVRTIAVFPSCRNACLNELNKLVKLSETGRS